MMRDVACMFVAAVPSLGHAATPTDQDIVDSYQYMLRLEISLSKIG
jgi:hypothetical protein